MKNNKISYTQLQAIVFLEMIGMESMILPKIGGNIYTILIMSIFTVLFIAVSCWLFNKFSYMKLQGIAGKILQFLFSAKIALVLGLALYIFSFFIKEIILENSKIWAIGIILLIGAVYCAISGIETVGRTAEIMLPFIAIPLIFAICVGIKKIDLENYNTLFENKDLWRGLMLSLNVTAVESVVLGKDYVNKSNLKIRIPKSIVFGLLFIIGVTSVAYGVYGDIDYNLQNFPTLEIIYTSGVFSFLQRQEEIFVCLWIFATALYLSSHLFFSQDLLAKSMGLKKELATVVIAVFAYIISFVPDNFNQALTEFCYINVYGSILFVLAVPLFVGRYLK